MVFMGSAFASSPKLRLIVLNRIQMFFVFVALVSLVGCGETSQAHYATSADASADRAFERGWLPEVMRADVTEIEESHDLDSNHGSATFRYNSQFKARLGSDCNRTPSGEVVRRPNNKWLKFMSKGQTPAQPSLKNLDAYRCGIFVVVLDSGKQLGYVWE